MTSSTASWSNTATGRMAPTMNPTAAHVCIEDIAIALSRQCRFGGHVRRDVEHYSVSQHSCHVADMCRYSKLEGLLHDASEAYVVDVPRPLKRALGPTYAVLEYSWALAIGAAFKLGSRLADLPLEVAVVDERMLATERRDLVDHKGRDWGLTEWPYPWEVKPWTAKQSEAEFLSRFYRLSREARHV